MNKPISMWMEELLTFIPKTRERNHQKFLTLIKKETSLMLLNILTNKIYPIFIIWITKRLNNNSCLINNLKTINTIIKPINYKTYQKTASYNSSDQPLNIGSLPSIMIHINYHI